MVCSLATLCTSLSPLPQEYATRRSDEMSINLKSFILPNYRDNRASRSLYNKITLAALNNNALSLLSIIEEHH
mgnify:CR=1 FL=1